VIICQSRDVLHDVPENQHTCTCGRAKTKIGEGVTVQFDYIPGKIKVLRHIYPKYACFCYKDDVTTAPTASDRIIGGLATPGLQAYVVVSKFVEHMPLYRQQDKLARANILIWRSTLCGLLEQCAQLLKPLVELMHKEVLKSEVIQRDKTPIPVLDQSRDSTRKGYVWSTIGDRAHPYKTYHYTDSRSRNGPADFLTCLC
jgi:transposase